MRTTIYDDFDNLKSAWKELCNSMKEDKILGRIHNFCVFAVNWIDNKLK